MSEENTGGPFKVDFKEIKVKKFKTVEGPELGEKLKQIFM